MKQLLNTVYVSEPDMYLALKGKNLNLLKTNESIARIPLHNIEAICTFGHQGASPALMGECMKQNISLTFFTSSGRFRGRLTGETNGNVALRKKQYRLSDNEEDSSKIARHMIIGKIFNSEQLLKRTVRDHALRVDVNRINQVIDRLQESRIVASECNDLDELRGIEGNAASNYYSVFTESILQQKDVFFFHERNRRPPLDPVNALLSFAYSLLASESAAALEGVGLDSYVGFLHRDRPGRTSLALDIMEELRSIIADRFVLKIINRKQISSKDFIVKENKAVILTDEARRTFLQLWQKEKQEDITHPYLKEKIPWGLVPHVQALLLARYLRGDLDAYPPILIR
ncbi:CRISPR-associated protein Cas1 [Virgibacillus natechei]|uniref:CRISPR-associated endonuclease Cas1 n=1 Tax=Virgibacillus natechei TaxID=1216297 RepID=A0ABS4IKZ8_9BACI|nr:type I-C CRISPR-associated endonuclease Cas1c [Virgibacillus natechei]MBP1971644.1 CRISPR-associated protein Cas1 [Virgibacillus natechei]UZD13868.1 type I-C CRISPR-associated endonuclease Cas1c [Virgibacillus natechei]